MSGISNQFAQHRGYQLMIFDVWQSADGHGADHGTRCEDQRDTTTDGDEVGGR